VIEESYGRFPRSPPTRTFSRLLLMTLSLTTTRPPARRGGHGDRGEPEDRSARDIPLGRLFAGRNFLLVHRIKKPFSHSVPFFQFAHTLEVWTGTESRPGPGRPPAAEEVPLNGVATGPRSPEWQPLRPATLVWVEALDGGDPEKEAPFRDRLLALEAPFSSPAREVHKTQHRAWACSG